jgi:hypothetical protein
VENRIYRVEIETDEFEQCVCVLLKKDVTTIQFFGFTTVARSTAVPALTQLQHRWVGWILPVAAE